MKRILSIVCILAFLLPTIVSCGEDTDHGEDTTSAAETTAALSAEAETTTEAETTAEPVPTDGLPDTNMDGFTFNILHHNEEWLTWTKTQLDAEETNAELINDAIYERNRSIESRFNAVINVEGTKQVNSIFSSIVSAGDNPYDIVYNYGVNVYGSVGLLADFSHIPYIDFEAEYWNPAASDIFKIGEKRLAAAGNFSLSYLSGASVFMFNKDMYGDLQLTEDLYQLVRDGKWTNDKFYEIARKAAADLDGDGVNDRFGTTASSVKAYIGAMMQGANFRLVQKDEEGYPTFNILENQSMVDFMQKLLEIYKNEPNVYTTHETNVNGGNSDIKFEEGDSLFREVYTIDIEKFRDMDIEFGILPCPKYNEDQEQYYGRTSIGEIAVLPRSYQEERLENIGMLLEALCFQSQQTVVPAYKEVLLKSKLSRDVDSSDMLDYIFAGLQFDAGRVCWEKEIGNVIADVYLQKADTLVSTLTGLTAASNKRINAFIKQVENMP